MQPYTRPSGKIQGELDSLAYFGTWLAAQAISQVVLDVGGPTDREGDACADLFRVVYKFHEFGMDSLIIGVLRIVGDDGNVKGDAANYWAAQIAFFTFSNGTNF